MIETPYIMTAAQVKTYLQISGTDYDTAIATYLPVVSSDIEKITNNKFIVRRTGTLTAASDEITDITTALLEPGMVVNTVDYEQAEILAVSETTLQIDTNATASIADSDIYINAFPLAKKPIAAAMVLHCIKKYTALMPEHGPLKSERVGSYSWAAANEGKGAAGYPQWMVDGLKEITRPRFY